MTQSPGIQVWVLTALTALLALAASAAADPIVPIDNPETVDIRFVPVDNSPGGPALDGFVTTDIRFDLSLEDQYATSHLLIELDQGSFYRDPLGSPVGRRPLEADLRLSMSLAFDTYFAGGGSGGGAVLLGAPPQAVFPVNGGMFLNQAWGPVGQPEIRGVVNFLDARITLSANASGTFEYLLFTGNSLRGEEASFRLGIITSGDFVVVPEPTTVMVFILVTNRGMFGRRFIKRFDT